MDSLQQGLRMLRALHIALLVSVVFYAIAGELVGPAEPRDLKIVPLALGISCILLAGIGFAVRARVAQPAAEALRLRPDDGRALERWRTGDLTSLVLGEPVGMAGLVLQILGGSRAGSAPFYAAAVLLMLMWTPRLEIPPRS